MSADLETIRALGGDAFTLLYLWLHHADGRPQTVKQLRVLAGGWSRHVVENACIVLEAQGLAAGSGEKDYDTWRLALPAFSVFPVSGATTVNHPRAEAEMAVIQPGSANQVRETRLGDPPREKKFFLSPPVVVNVVDSEGPQDSQQQQTTTPAKNIFLPPDVPIADPRQDFLDANPGINPAIYDQALRWLFAFGVWEDKARQAAERIAVDEWREVNNGPGYYITRAHLLGWIVQMRHEPADLPEAALASNLIARRKCKNKYLPPRLCTTCQRAEGYCHCANSQYDYPGGLFDRAMDENCDTWTCRTCHALPCACPPEPPSPPETSTLSGGLSGHEALRNGSRNPKSKGALPDEPTITGWHGLGMSPDLAWQAALGQVQMEMPKATFDTWVRDAKFAGYEHGRFTIWLHNAYARDWVESRLSSTLARIMAGIMNQEIKLEFIT